MPDFDLSNVIVGRTRDEIRAQVQRLEFLLPLLADYEDVGRDQATAVQCLNLFLRETLAGTSHISFHGHAVGTFVLAQVALCIQWLSNTYAARFIPPPSDGWVLDDAKISLRPSSEQKFVY